MQQIENIKNKKEEERIKKKAGKGEENRTKDSRRDQRSQRDDRRYLAGIKECPRDQGRYNGLGF